MRTDFALPNVRDEFAAPVPAAAIASCSRKRSPIVRPNSESAPAWIRSRREMPSHSLRLLPRIRRIDMPHSPTHKVPLITQSAEGIESYSRFGGYLVHQQPCYRDRYTTRSVQSTDACAAH